MKKDDFITINEMFRRLNKIKRFYTILDKLTFLHILLIWSGIVVFFGLLYSLLSNPSSFLAYVFNNERVKSLGDNIYFSFISATSGFSGITANGLFKLVSIFEVVCGLLLLALLTSKLVSIKQDVILNEIYEISFRERISRIRSSLLLFRQNINRIIGNIEDGSVRRREISDLYTHFSSLENTLHEVINIFSKTGSAHFVKEIDSLNAELILNGVLNSFERTEELLSTLNKSGMEWRRDITLDLINRCIKANEVLFDRVNSIKNVPEKVLFDFNAQKKKIIDSIKSGLNPKVDNENIVKVVDIK